MSEEILTVIGVRSNVPTALYFTSSRVIVARTASTAARIVGYAFGWGGQAAEEHGEDKKAEELSKLPPESILADNKKNYAISYTDIIQVELFKKMLSGQQIRITAGKDKYQFRLSKPKEVANYINILRSVFGDKLVVS